MNKVILKNKNGGGREEQIVSDSPSIKKLIILTNLLIKVIYIITITCKSLILIE